MDQHHGFMGSKALSFTWGTVLTGASTLGALWIASKIYGVLSWAPRKPASDTPESGHPGGVIELLPVNGLDRHSSPFVAKLEAFLRLSGLPYRGAKLGFEKAPKGKIPFIVHGPHVIGDSEFIMEYLRRTYGKQAGVKLVPEVAPSLKWQATAVQRMVDEHMYFCLLLAKWVWADGWARLVRTDMFDRWIPKLMQPLVRPTIRKTVTAQAWQQGMGRHSRRDVMAVLSQDLEALAGALGSHKFMLGSPEPTTLDCSCFGLLDKLLEPEVVPDLHAAVSVHPTLVAYHARMRALVEAAPGPVAA